MSKRLQPVDTGYVDQLKDDERPCVLRLSNSIKWLYRHKMKTTLINNAIPFETLSKAFIPCFSLQFCSPNPIQGDFTRYCRHYPLFVGY